MIKLIYRLLCIVLFIIVLIVSFKLSPSVRSLNALNNYLKTDYSKFTIIRDLKYSDLDTNDYDLYLPNDNSKQNYSFVLFIHAGGFTSGDKWEAPNCEYAASKGYVCASINYTTHTKEHPSNLNIMMDEVKESVEVIYQEAKHRGYHLNEMAVSGDSAGCTLALMYAYRDAETSPIPVKFVFGEVGPASFDLDDWYPNQIIDNDLDKSSIEWVKTMTGIDVTLEQMKNGTYKQYLKEISPYAYVNEDSIPTLIAYGKLDKVQPFKAHLKLVDALDMYGIPYSYYVFPNSGHALYSDPDIAKLYMDKIVTYYDMYFEN